MPKIYHIPRDNRNIPYEIPRKHIRGYRKVFWYDEVRGVRMGNQVVNPNYVKDEMADYLDRKNGWDIEELKARRKDTAV